MCMIGSEARRPRQVHGDSPSPQVLLPTVKLQLLEGSGSDTKSVSTEIDGFRDIEQGAFSCAKER